MLNPLHRSAFFATVLCVLLPGPALAYIGPGADIGQSGTRQKNAQDCREKSGAVERVQHILPHLFVRWSMPCLRHMSWIALLPFDLEIFGREDRGIGDLAHEVLVIKVDVLPKNPSVRIHLQDTPRIELGDQ